MKVKENIFPMVDATGKPVDLEREKKISVLNNGEDKGAQLKDLFIRHELDGNEIVGFSLLRYFEVKDGILVDKEGNTVSLAISDKNIPIFFSEIDVKFVPLDAIEVPLNYIEAFAYSLIGMEKPEVIFSDLSNSEKKTIVDARDEKNKLKAEADLADADKAKADADKAKADADKAKADADKAKADADKELEEAEEKALAEKTLKASINPQFVYEKKDYLNIQEVFTEDGGKEYVQDPYHFFHVPATEEDSDPRPATVLIKRGDNWFQEDEDGEVLVENEKTIEYKFSDGETSKIITLDVENGTISVNNAGNQEQ